MRTRGNHTHFTYARGGASETTGTGTETMYTHFTYARGGALSHARYWLLLMTVAMLGLLCGPVGAAPYSNNPEKHAPGAGTEDDPYIIASVDDLEELAATPADWDDHFRQLHDINMAGRPAIYPIGTNVGGDVTAQGDGLGQPFTGTYDGSFTSAGGITTRCTIRNLVVVGRPPGFAGGLGDGLFGVVQGAPGVKVIQRVTLAGPTVFGTHANVGALVGWLQSGTVDACAVRGGFVASWVPGNTGGLVGRVGTVAGGGVVDKCWSTATVWGPADVGGLIGWSSGTVQNCWATGGVNSFWGPNVGGLMGQNFTGTVQACYANSTGIAAPPGNVGSLVGLWTEPNGSWYLWPANYSNEETPGVPAPGVGRTSNGIGTGVNPGLWVDRVAVSVAPEELEDAGTFAGWFYLGSPWLMPGPARTPDLAENPFYRSLRKELNVPMP